MGAKLAFPTAEIAVMGPAAAANIMYCDEIADADARREQLIDEYRERFAHTFKAAELGLHR